MKIVDWGKETAVQHKINGSKHYCFYKTMLCGLLAILNFIWSYCRSILWKYWMRLRLLLKFIIIFALDRYCKKHWKNKIKMKHYDVVLFYLFFIIFSFAACNKKSIIFFNNIDYTKICTFSHLHMYSWLCVCFLYHFLCILNTVCTML